MRVMKNIRKVENHINNMTKTVVTGLSLSLLLSVNSGLTLLANACEQHKNSAQGDVAKASTAVSEAWRKKPPTLPEPRSFHLPTIEKYTLDNGLKVELVQDKRVPFVTVALGFRVGKDFDPQNKKGLSGLTGDMLTEGTDKKSSKQIAEAVDFIGGSIGANCDYDFTTISGSSLSNYQDRLFGLMSDVLLHPSFPQDELNLKKTNLLQELAVKRSEPEFLLNERFQSVLYGKHPYATLMPSASDIKNIERADLVKFHQEHFSPDNSILLVLGDFQNDKIKALVEKSFGSQVWKKEKLEQAEKEPMPEYSGRKIFLVDRPGSVQTALKLGNRSFKRSDSDYYSALVAGQILGGSSHSRLFNNIRENKGYTYGAYSRFSARKDPGTFSAFADVRTEVTAPSVQEFLYELDKIRNLKVSDEELKAAKAYLVGSFQLGLETQSGLAQRLLEQQLYDLPDDYLEKFSQNVMAVNADDVRRVAHKYIDMDNLTIVAVGDASKIKKELEYFAPIEVYNVDGKMVEHGDSKTDKSISSR